MTSRSRRLGDPETPIQLGKAKRTIPADPRAETRHSRSGLFLLRYVTQIDPTGEDFEQALADVAHHIRIHYRCSGVVIRQRDGNVLRRIAADLRESKEVPELIPSTQGISDYVVRTKMPIIIRDAEVDPITRDLYERQRRASGKFGFESFAAFPMMNNNEVAAILGMSFDQKHLNLPQDDEETIQAIANHIGSWLRAREAESNLRDELRRANDAIERLEKYIGRMQRRYEKGAGMIDPGSEMPVPLRKEGNSEDRPKILIVEDSTTNAMILRRVLTNLGISEIFEARDGIEGLEKCERTEYSIVLMDLNMPRMDGWEATRRIRKISPYYKNVPIIAVSTSSLESDRTRAIESGVSEFIAKPYKTRTVREVLTKFLPSLL